MIHNSNNNSGYIVLTTMILVGALVTIATMATLYQGTQFLRLAGKKNLNQQAYLLAQSCAEVGLREVVIGATLTDYPAVDYYELTSLELDYQGTSYTPSTNGYCWVSHATNGSNKAVYATGFFRDETSELTLILDSNNNLIYQHSGISPP
jgi:hypothetical protein